VLYSDGAGVRRSFSRAIEWWKKAARQKDNKAEFNLGLAYLYGEGVPKNRAHAKLWLRKAANHGNRRAKRFLAGLERHHD
jgi:hypothetical protein